MAAPQHKLETWRNRVGTERSQGLPHSGLPQTVLTGPQRDVVVVRISSELLHLF